LPWLISIKPTSGITRFNVAEPTGPSADLAEHHKRGGVRIPAMANIWTLGFFTNRVELAPAQISFDIKVGLTSWNRCF
jgi:hypothetical protein